jgi:SAM-dependent methyltransferase
VTVEPCALCGATGFRPVSSTLRGGRPGTIVECEKCGLIFQVQQTGREEIYRFYSHDFPGNYQYREQINRERHARLRPGLRPDLDVLEVGCSSGEFLDLIRPAVRSVAGVELVPHDVEAARGRRGLTIYDRPVEELGLERGVDLVLAFQTFEHIPDPNQFLACVRRMLRDGGRLVLEVPNVREPLLALYRLDVFRRFYFVPQHLFYYSQDTLPRMLAKHGFVPHAPRLVQMGSLTNHLHWIHARGPQRDLREVCTVVLPEDAASAEAVAALEAADGAYRSALVERGYSDTLWIEADVEPAA